MKWPCLVFDDRVLCGHVASEQRSEKFGGGWWHSTGTAYPKIPAPLFAVPSTKSTPTPKAEPDFLDAVYRRAQEISEPLDGRRELQAFTCAKRGMSKPQVDMRGYFPWPSIAERYVEGYRREGDSRWLLAAKLAVEFGSGFANVPGFGHHKESGRPWVAGWNGIFLPAQDPLGRIVGGQVLVPEKTRRKKPSAPKYATVSCGGKVVGASSGFLLHCSRPTGQGACPIRPDLSRVWITEGILKADIVSDLIGENVLGGSGQTYDIEALAEYLSALEAVEVVVALDQDKPGSAAAKTTERNAQKLADQLVDLGYRVSVAVWDHEEGKGLDDLLLGNGSPVLKDYIGRRRRPRLAPKIDAIEPPVDLRPVVSVADQREEYRDTLRDYLANRQGQSNEEVLLVRLAPGIGKTTNFEEIAKEYIDRDALRSLTHFVSNHEVGHQLEQSQWYQVYGRTFEKSPSGQPCHQQERAKALQAYGETRGDICKLCPLQNDCKSAEERSKDKPFYLGQFRRRQLTRLPAAHLLSPDLVAKCGHGPLVIDDVDLDALQISSTWITETDIIENLRRANGEDDPEEDSSARVNLRPAVSLLEITRDYRRYLADTLVDGEQYPQGSDLVVALARWAEETGRSLDAAVKSAKTAAEYDPLEGIYSLDQLDLEALGPKPIVSKLAQILSIELGHIASGLESWNSRLSCGRPPGPDSKRHGLSFQVWEHRPLPLEAYKSRPIVILNASMTQEQAQRLFPTRKIRVLEPRAPLPEGVIITQHLDRNYGKTALERDQKSQEQALGEVREIIESHKGQKVGVITHKGFAKTLEAEFPTLTVMHFFGHRSLNTAADVNAWIVLGTPCPNETALARTTEALYWQDGRPLDHTVGYRTQQVESVDGLQYSVSRRTALDPRLQEQLEQRTSLEMEQALFRCRPHNIDTPSQLDLYRPDQRTGRKSLDIYVFSSMSLGIPVNVVSTDAARKPEALDLVVDAARKFVRAGSRPTQRGLEVALKEQGLEVSYRQVIRALKWLHRERGEQWLEDLAIEETPPRATSEPPLEEVEERLLIPALPPARPVVRERDRSMWDFSQVEHPRRLSPKASILPHESVVPRLRRAPPPTGEELREALSAII